MMYSQLAGYLAMFSIFFSLGFYFFDRASMFNYTLRHGFSDYGVPLSVVIYIWISYTVKDHVDVARIQMPHNFEPTYIPNDDDGQARSRYQGFGQSNQLVFVVSTSRPFPSSPSASSTRSQSSASPKGSTTTP